MTNPSQRSLWSVFQDYKANRQLKVKTIAAYEAVLRRCLADWLYEPMGQITGQAVLEKHRQLSLEGKAQADLTFRVVRALFEFAQAYYEMPDGSPEFPHNPVKKLSGMKAWHGLKRRTGRVAPVDLPRWWDGVKELPPVQREYYLFLLYTGMRKTEAGHIEWQNIDLERNTITVKDTKNGSDFVLPMTTYIRDIVDYMSSYRKEKYLFPGQFLDSHISDYDSHYREVSRKTGIEFTPHDLRRGFMSTASELKLAPYTIKKLMNHACSDVTYGYYVADLNKLRESLQLIDEQLVREIYGDSLSA